jgi:hypothetical protein
MISLSLSLLPVTNEHLTIKLLCFSCEASKHLVGAIPFFSFHRIQKHIQLQPYVFPIPTF